MKEYLRNNPNEIEKIFTYLNPKKVKELVDSTNSQCL